LARRGRTITIEELVAGTLILYPRYIDWQNNEIIPVETALNRLEQDRCSSASRKNVDSGIIAQWLRKLSGFFDALW